MKNREKIVEIVEAGIAKKGLEKAIAINDEMIEYIEKNRACSEKIFEYEDKAEMVYYIKEYLSRK